MTNQLIEKLDQVKAQIIEAFCQKQDMYFEDWADTDSKEIACFGDVLFLNFSEIVFDLQTNQPKSLIVKYLYDSLEANQDLEHEKRKFINYPSYCMGARYDLPKKEVEFDSGDLTPEEYAKLKAEMEKIAEGLDYEVFDPKKEKKTRIEITDQGMSSVQF